MVCQKPTQNEIGKKRQGNWRGLVPKPYAEGAPWQRQGLILVGLVVEFLAIDLITQ